MNAAQLGITREMVVAAEALADAAERLAKVKPVVEGYKREILAAHKFYVVQDLLDSDAPELIVEPRDDWKMSDGDFMVYQAACHARRTELGYEVSDLDHCPLLLAERDFRLAEIGLLQAMSAHPQLGHLKDPAKLPPLARNQALKAAKTVMRSFVRQGRSLG